MKEFKARASASGKLLVKPRAKTETLSETTKTYLKEWAIEEIYSVKKEIKSKQISKGIQLEDEAIDKAIAWLDLPFTLKNEQYFEDDHFTGTPDLITADEILDIKCSWSPFTFPLFENDIPTKDYEYQVQVYMHLTGKKKARVVYMLLNTPEELAPYEPAYTFDHMDKDYRVKDFAFEYDENVIIELQAKVIEGREYLKSIL